MKRVLAIVLSAVLALTLLAGCGGSGSGSSTGHSQKVTTRNLHKKLSFYFKKLRQMNEMRILAHLLAQV